MRGVAFVDPVGPDLATVSEDTISRITDTVSEQTGQWRDRPWNGSGPEGNVGGMLWGRASESARLDAVFADAAAGRGGVVVVRGEPGVGKSGRSTLIWPHCSSLIWPHPGAWAAGW